MRLLPALPLFLALVACEKDADEPLDTDLVDVDTDTDTDLADTDVIDTDVDTDTDETDTDTDTDETDTDVVDTDTDGVDTDTDGVDSDTDTDVVDTDTVDSGGEDSADTAEEDTDTDVVDTDTVDSGGEDSADTAEEDTDDTDVVDTDVLDSGDTAEDDTDTAAVDTDTDGVDTDTDTDVALGTLDHALVGLALAPAGQGFDLDQDGTIDNALRAFAGAVDPLLADGLVASDVVIVLQLSGVDDLDADAAARLAIFPALDLDGDPTDNDAGGEPVQPAQGAVGEDGVALRSTPVEVLDGSYVATWLDTSIVLGGVALPTATPVRLRGTVTVDTHVGVIGFGLATTTLVDLLTEAGQGSLAALVPLFADLDTDGNGSFDAISFALSFEAAAVVLTP